MLCVRATDPVGNSSTNSLQVVAVMSNQYFVSDTENYHRKNFNKFVVPRAIIDADAVINLPK